MNSEILDSIEKKVETRSYLKVLKNSLPVLILLIVVMFSILTYATTNHAITTPKILGIVCVVLSASIYFFVNKDTGIWVLTSILFLSLFGIVKFTPTYTTFSILGITLPPFPVFMFSFTIFWSKNYLRSGLEKLKKITIVRKILDYWYSIPE
jgi:membrane-bound ClpP family serine protease